MVAGGGRGLGKSLVKSPAEAGTTSGLGRRFAKVLAACGAKVALTGRRVERLESLVEEIRGDGDVCEAYAMDMTNRDNMCSVVEKASEALGTISVLVNNAGIPESVQSCTMPEGVIDNVMETDLTGPFILSREIARRLIEKDLPGKNCPYLIDGCVRCQSKIWATALFCL